MSLSIAKAVSITLSLIVMSMLLPRGILYLLGAQYTNVTVGGHVVTWAQLDPIINTIFTVILPLVIAIVSIMYYVPKGKKGR